MKKKRQWVKQCVVMLLVCGTFFASACDSGKRYPGTYVVVSGTSPSQVETVLELQENGQGVWRTNEKEVPFRWSVKGKEIRLHTKEGGVIMGSIADEVITVRLPGDIVLFFQKKSTY